MITNILLTLILCAVLFLAVVIFALRSEIEALKEEVQATREPILHEVPRPGRRSHFSK